MAVEVSVKQMALTRNQEFLERTQAMLAKVAVDVMSEPGTTPYHNLRALYGQRVLGMPQQAAQNGITIVVMGVNVIVTTVYDEASKTSTCTIADIDLQSQIMNLWNALAGIDTPS